MSSRNGNRNGTSGLGIPKDFEPKNLSQKRAVEKFQDSDILFLMGGAGFGKSFCALALALQELQARRVRKVLLFRPAVTAEEELGYLPGSLHEKLEPFFHSVPALLEKMELSSELLKHIEYLSLGHLRGSTFEDCVAILSEAQNATYSQLKLFLTRLGPRSKLIVEGDAEQSDLDCNALPTVVHKLKGLAGVSVVCFGGPGDQNLRHPLIPQILKRLS